MGNDQIATTVAVGYQNCGRQWRKGMGLLSVGAEWHIVSPTVLHPMKLIESNADVGELLKRAKMLPKLKCKNLSPFAGEIYLFSVLKPTPSFFHSYSCISTPPIPCGSNPLIFINICLERAGVPPGGRARRVAGKQKGRSMTKPQFYLKFQCANRNRILYYGPLFLGRRFLL